MLRTNAASLVLLCLLSIVTTTKAFQVDVSAPDVVIIDPSGPYVTTETPNFTIRALIRSRIPFAGVTVSVNGTPVYTQLFGGSENDRFKYIFEHTVSLQPGKNLILFAISVLGKHNSLGSSDNLFRCITENAFRAGIP